MNKNKLLSASKILTNIFGVLFGIIVLGSIILNENSAAVNSFLSVSTQKMEFSEQSQKILEENPLAFDYYPSSFDSVSQVKQNGEKIIEEVVAEGAVLLKNEDNALPLKKGSRSVSLFSTSSVDLVYAGTGSSGTNTSPSADMKTAMERAGFEVNEKLWNWYKDNLDTYGRGAAGGTVGQTFDIKDAPWEKIGTDAKTDKNYGDAAIFVLSRNGGEGADLTLKGGDASDKTNGNYLQLSPSEISVLKNLNALKGKVFDKIIVIMNSANQVQCDFVDNPEYGIDALLWCGDLGSTGAYAVADILAGNVNPSGRLTDTFWKEHRYNPVYANWGAYNYSGGISWGKSDTYVVYQEGIYNGYRYTETRYEDVVLGRDGAGDFNYDEVVAYPFGYGLSYTDFTYTDFDVSKTEDDKYTVTVKVRNDGDVAGKEVVQIYLQKPYTDYDMENKVEKAAVELVGFDKTDILNPGESAVVTVKVDGSYFASYDAYNAKTYIVDKGDYYFATGKNAHDALNNILALKQQSADYGNAELAYSVNVKKFDAETYSVSESAMQSGLLDTSVKITNQFDNADLNLYEGRGGNKVEYISRSDWEGTVKLGLDENNSDLKNQVVIKGTDEMRADVKAPQVKADDVEYPVYGSTETSYRLADLRAFDDGNDDISDDKLIPFNDERWDDLLDQLTWDATVELLRDGFRRTGALGSPVSDIAKPETIDHNGATGPTQPYGSNGNAANPSGSVNQGLAIRLNDPDKDQTPALYPCNGICAATYNTELMEEYGRAWGEDCLWSGYNGLYGPGLNLHRGAYCGRAFEYFSEDGVLTGIISAAMTGGLSEKGVYVYLKHCVLNDQETNREGICTWANEQTIRELYLRGFQIAIEDGGADCVMTGFNRLGVVWTGHQGFCKTVLHNEFGMTGFAVSDWYQDYMTLGYGILNGNDLPDGTCSASQLDMYREGYGELAWAMRDAVHRILYTVVHSNAMNGKPADMSLTMVTPWWSNLMVALISVTAVLLVASIAGMVILHVKERKNIKNNS